MVLTIDIGNTNIVFGGFDGDTLQFVSRANTNHTQTVDEYAIILNNIFGLYGVNASSFDGGIISSVVPKLTPVLKRAGERIMGCEVLYISPGIKTGINIQTDNASILGADFVAAAAGAVAHYPLPCIMVDLGTATKISAVTKEHAFIGTSIMPGVNISLDALSSRTAQLPHISIEGVPPVIGTNTIDSMRSGIVYGTASSIDGVVSMYMEILGKESSVVATGGIAEAIIPHCKSRIVLDNELILKGLLQIYRKNL